MAGSKPCDPACSPAEAQPWFHAVIGPTGRELLSQHCPSREEDDGHSQNRYFAVASDLRFPSLELGAEELPATGLTIQAEIPRAGDFMGFGFESFWMMARPAIQLSAAGLWSGSMLRITALRKLSSTAMASLEPWARRRRGVGACLGPKHDPQDRSQHQQAGQEIPAQMVDREGSIGVGEDGVWVLTATESSSRKDTILTRYNPQNWSD